MNKSYSLFIDTTQNYCNLAILDDQNSIMNKLQILTHNNMTDVVVEKISELLNPTNVDKKDIKNIYLLIGPGSFTGCRVGYIIAESFKSVNNCNILYTNSLLFQLPKGTGISLIDAKSNKFFVAIYDQYKEILSPKLIDANELDSIKKQYSNFEIYLDYQNIDVFKNLLANINNAFIKLPNGEKIVPLYIKGFTN